LQQGERFVDDNVHKERSNLAHSFQSAFENEELLAKIIEFFPYPIQVYTPDGTSVMVNQALLREYHIFSSDMIIGKYNIFEDPSVIELGLLTHKEKLFMGETIFLTDIKVPLKEIALRYGIEDLDLEAVFQDITIFPIMDNSNKLSYIVALLINRRVYRGKYEIVEAREYIENQWLNPFDMNETAKAAGLSKTHFRRLFKKHTGMTPHEYYMNFKINKVKEKLSDPDLSISQAFAACGADYNGYLARKFKEKVGASPSQYRNKTTQNK